MAIDNPIDAVESQYPEPSEPPVGLVLSIGQLAFPIAAPALEFVKLLNDHLSKDRREERVRAFFELLRDNQKILEALSSSVDRLNVKLDDLAEAAQVAAWRDADAFNDLKRERYLKILGSAVRSSDQIQDLASFIRDVEMLGEQDILVLKTLNSVMNKPGDWRSPDAHGGVLTSLHANTFIHRRQELDEKIAVALGMKIDEDAKKNGLPQRHSREDGYSICARLQGFGLAHEVQVSSREVPVGDYCFRPSKRGLMLLKLIGEEVPNWTYFFPLEGP